MSVCVDSYSTSAVVCFSAAETHLPLLKRGCFVTKRSEHEKCILLSGVNTQSLRESLIFSHLVGGKSF